MGWLAAVWGASQYKSTGTLAARGRKDRLRKGASDVDEWKGSQIETFENIVRVCARRRVGTRCFAGDHVVCPRPEGTREVLEDREREQENNRILEVYLGPRLGVAAL